LAGYVAEIVDEPLHEATTRSVLPGALALENRWHRRLWAIAAANAREQPDSNGVQLYVESLNAMFALRADRAMIESSKVRAPIWATLYGLMMLAVFGVGYQLGVAGSKRTKIGVALSFCFALVISLIADLDRSNGYIEISEQPLADLRASITSATRAAR